MKNIIKPKINKIIIINNLKKIIVISSYIYLIKSSYKHYSKDDITLVTALFKIKSKFPFEAYLNWVENLLLLNTSIVFFADKETSIIINSKRPKLYENKTVFIQSSIKDFYSYKKFKKNFEDSYKIDKENSYHTVPLYMVWAEKCYFLKKAIYRNYFNSKCFYWIDAGYFRIKEDKYIKNWPSNKKCFEDPRVIINGMRKLPDEEIKGIKNFNITALKDFNNNKLNVAGGLFGGMPYYLRKFIKLYYKTIKDFIN